MLCFRNLFIVSHFCNFLTCKFDLALRTQPADLNKIIKYYAVARYPAAGNDTQNARYPAAGNDTQNARYPAAGNDTQNARYPAARNDTQNALKMLDTRQPGKIQKFEKMFDTCDRE